jgi:hypothetical protein
MDKTGVAKRLLIIMCILIFIVPVGLSGCSIVKRDSKKVSDLDFTVVEDQDLPIELKKLIDEKKSNTLRLTYTTKDYTYAVVSYGTQKTSGYSIKVNDVYLGSNAIYVDVTLIGPAAGEQVTETPTTPYIVIKYERREESVIFSI